MTRAITRQQARQIDRVAINELGYPGPVLMENAGRGCVDVMEAVGVHGLAIVVAGKGNNAGDGFVIARHLALRGHRVKVALASAPHTLRGDALTAFKMLTPCRGVTLIDLTGVHAGEMIAELDGLGDAQWIVDALLGTGATGPPRPPYDAVIDWINTEPGMTLAVDAPSGLDCDTGEPTTTTVAADVTCTFVAPKIGFDNPAAADHLGVVRVIDIGVPPSVIERAVRQAK